MDSVATEEDVIKRVIEKYGTYRPVEVKEVLKYMKLYLQEKNKENGNIYIDLRGLGRLYRTKKTYEDTDLWKDPEELKHLVLYYTDPISKNFLIEDKNKNLIHVEDTSLKIQEKQE